MKGSFHECTQANDSLSSVFAVRNFNCPLLFITFYWSWALSHGIGKSAYIVIQWGQCQMLSWNLKSETTQWCWGQCLMLWLNPDVGSPGADVRAVTNSRTKCSQAPCVRVVTNPRTKCSQAPGVRAVLRKLVDSTGRHGHHAHLWIWRAGYICGEEPKLVLLWKCFPSSIEKSDLMVP